jgi:hypothetical protein
MKHDRRSDVTLRLSIDNLHCILFVLKTDPHDMCQTCNDVHFIVTSDNQLVVTSMMSPFIFTIMNMIENRLLKIKSDHVLSIR